MSDLGLAFRQAAFGLKGYLRNPRALAFAVAMPVGLLLLFNSVFGTGEATTSFLGRDVKLVGYFTAGVAAYSVMLSTFSSLLIGLVSEREAGRLKRYQGTPMPPWVFFAGQIGFVFVVTAAMTAVLSVIGIVGYGVDLPADRIPALALYVALGVFTFASLAIALSRVVSTPEMASSVGPFSVVALGFISGVFVPAESLPSWLQEVGRVFPLAPLATGMQSVFADAGQALRPEAIAVLALWGLVALAVAVRAFTWQPLAAGR